MTFLRKLNTSCRVTLLHWTIVGIVHYFRSREISFLMLLTVLFSQNYVNMLCTYMGNKKSHKQRATCNMRRATCDVQHSHATKLWLPDSQRLTKNRQDICFTGCWRLEVRAWRNWVLVSVTRVVTNGDALKAAPGRPNKNYRELYKNVFVNGNIEPSVL